MTELWKHDIPVPKTLTEQKRIVRRIKECMERIEEIESDRQLLDIELGALFPAILHERFVDLQRSAACEVLEAIAAIKGGGSLPRGSGSDTGGNSILLVKVGDMNLPGNERTILQSREYSPLQQVGSHVIPPGAVIFPKRGGAIATNKKRLLSRPALIDPNLMALIPKEGRVISEYLYYWTQTLNLENISNGGVVPQLNRKDLISLQVPLPSLIIQKRIVEELRGAEAACFEVRALISQSSGEKRALRSLILLKAFSGEL
jgi:type I restriction enzyme S subunit